MNNTLPKMEVSRLNAILRMLFNKIENLGDDKTVLSPFWSMMHTFSASQLAKIIAMKRGLDPELAAIIAALHDIGVIELNEKEDHGEKGSQLIISWCDTYNASYGKKRGYISEDEMTIIREAVANHSHKSIFTDQSYIELIKDVDSLDRYLHGIETTSDYEVRTNGLLEELNIKTTTGDKEKALLYSIH